MPQQYYELEEAARILGMDPEELRQKAMARELPALRDSDTWRFKADAVEEYGRKRGLGSDPDLPLSDLDIPNPAGDAYDTADEDPELSEFQLGVARSDLGPMSMDIPTSGSVSDEDILLDDSLLPLNQGSSSSSHIIGMGGGGKVPSDSDVRLVPDGPKGASDSDVQLSGEAPAAKHRPSDSDVTLVQEGSGSFDSLSTFEAGSDPSGETTLRPSPLAEMPSARLRTEPDGHGADNEDDSDFELTPSSVIDALQPESGSDFELTALDGSDEFEATPRLRPGDSDVTGAPPQTSGINLGKPSDSGINLDLVGSDLSQNESIELAPLDDSGELDKPKGKAGVKSDPSATALPVKAQAPKDIFEDTDFEVDALDLQTDDNTMHLEAASDFDLEESESGSEVFAVDEDDVDQNAATAMGPAVLESDDAVSAAMDLEGGSGEMAGGSWDEDAPAATPSRQAAAVATPASSLLAASQGPEWGGVWVGLLSVATICMIALSFITMDVVRNLNSYQGDGPASGLVRMIAGGE